MAEGWDDWNDGFEDISSQSIPTNTTSNDDYAWVDDNTQASSSFNGEESQLSNWQEDDFSQDLSNNDWNTSQSSSDDWGTSQSSSDDWSTSQSSSDDWGDFSSNSDVNDKKFNLNLKQAGVIIAVGFILLALVLYIINSINISKKPADINQQQEQQQSVSQSNTVNNQVNEGVSNTSTNKSDVGLVSVPNNASIDYSGKIYEATGSVVNKTKYLCNNQLVYLIQVEIPFGSGTMTVNYFCGYNVYNNVATGDIVTVNYQQVSDTCFSVNTLVK